MGTPILPRTVPRSRDLRDLSRGGFRRFDAPWEDEDNLPATGTFKLVLDTKDEAFNIVTFGLGISWVNDAGKLSSIDLGADAGGDAVNIALGYTHEF